MSSSKIETRMKTFREARNLSQIALAGAVGVSRQTINAIETGKQAPSLGLAFAIARHFGVAIEEVFSPVP